jgi:hypothetical protein
MRLDRKPSSQHGPTPSRRFDHQHTLCESTDQSITPRELARPWRTVHGILTDQCATTLPHLIKEARVLGRVRTPQPAAHHHNRSPASSQRCTMCFCIDSPRAARYNDHPSICAGSGKATGLSEPNAAAPTGANNGNRWRRKHAALPSHTKQRWWIRNMHHLRREGIIIKWQKHAIDTTEPLSFIAGSTSSNRRAKRLASRVRHVCWPINAHTTICSSHDRINIAEVLQQAANRVRADTFGGSQTQPVQTRLGTWGHRGTVAPL